MSTKTAFASEKNTAVTLGLISVLLTLILVSLPLLIAPVFLA